MDRVFHQLAVLMTTAFLGILVFSLDFPAISKTPAIETGELAIDWISENSQ